MKVLVVSGFLGAGKTTIIKTMSEKTGRDFCVFENEYAQADIDKALLSQDGTMNIWELTENCICCSGKQDFAATVLTISNTVDPEYLIVEPTGVAMLSSVLSNLRKVEYERISVLPPVTILDGTTIHKDFKSMGEIYRDQILSSQEIVLSKMESMEETERLDACEVIRRINPAAHVLTEHYSKMEKDWWMALLNRQPLAEPDPAGSVETDDYEIGTDRDGLPVLNALPGRGPENIALSGVSLPSPVHLISFLEMVTFGVYGEIFRAKGFLPCGGQWLRFDIVDTTYSITGVELQPEARTVFIGNNLNRQGIRSVLLYRKPRMQYNR